MPIQAAQSLRIPCALLALMLALLSDLQAQTTVTVTDTEDWAGWLKPNGDPYLPDVNSDQQTGQKHADFVGDSATPAFMMKTGLVDGDGFIFFRSRMDEMNSGGDLKTNIIIGMNLNVMTQTQTGPSTIDFYMIMVSPNNANANNPSYLQFASPGASANTGPSTTTIVVNDAYDLTLTNSTYNYALADSYFNTTQDAYVTFGLSFQALTAAIRALAGAAFANYTFDANSVVSYVASTSTQNNALNQDLLGVDGSGGSLTWDALGAATFPMFPDGRPVPEPATYVQVGVLLLAGGVLAHRRRRQQALTATRAVD